MSSPQDNSQRSPRRPGAPRLPGLDWLRAVAALLVVALHAGIAYLVVPMPGLAWATQDAAGSAPVDALTWWIDSFVMPLFVFLGGFLAAQVFQTRGQAEFLRHRTQRLLGPFLFACVVILPLDLYAWLLSWAAQGWIPAKKLRSLKVDSPLGDHLWGVSHLWFLQYLWVFCMAAWGASRIRSQISPYLARRWGTSATRETLPLKPARFRGAPVALLALSAGALWLEPQILIGFRHSWWPLPANLLFFGPWFLFGWLSMAEATTRQSASVTLPPKPTMAWCEGRLIAAGLLLPFLLTLIHRQATTPLAGTERITLAVLFVLHAWLLVTGSVGVCLKWIHQPAPPAVRYLAEASFWIYLFHHPVVGLTQADLAPLSWPVEIKFAVSFMVALTLSLLTYQAAVRHTWVGALLNGRRVPRPRLAQPIDLRPLPRPDSEPLRKSA